MRATSRNSIQNSTTPTIDRSALVIQQTPQQNSCSEAINTVDNVAEVISTMDRVAGVISTGVVEIFGVVEVEAPVVAEMVVAEVCLVIVPTGTWPTHSETC